MIEHWNDGAAFPPGSKLCRHFFCTRIDTTEKYVAGKPGHMSEVRYPYCPEHEPQFTHNGTQSDCTMLLIYWAVAFACSLLMPYFVLALPTIPVFWILERCFPDSYRLQQTPQVLYVVFFGLSFIVTCMAWALYWSF
jgi:hypothetical protein